MRYIIFSRVSTGDQTTENQILECRQYVKDQFKPGDEIVEFDEGANSTRLEMKDRPVLLEMLESLRRHDTLVIYKLSRLARTGHELTSIYADLIKRGITVMSLYEKQLDDMMIHAYAMVGQAERKNIREATISGLNRKKKKMEKVGTAWYGYKTDETRLQLERENCRSYNKPYLLIPEETEQEQVRLMIVWFEAGFSYGQIASELAAKGFANRAGNPVNKMTVYRILKRLGKQRQAPMAEALR